MIIRKAARLDATSEYYFSVKLKEIASLRKEGYDIINLGIGSPDLTPDESVIKELQQTSGLRSAHGYQGYQGIPELRNAIAGYLQKYYRVSFDPDDEVLPLIGSKEGIMHIFLAYVNPGDTVMIPDPGYPTYRSAASLSQANTHAYHLKEENDWNIDLDDLRKQPLDDVKVFWLNYPHMPTGAKADPSIIAELIEMARIHGFLIVNDNPYSQLYSGDPFTIFQIPGAREVAIELNSMSKSHNMAGWRVGWVTGKNDYLDPIIKVKSNMDSGMFYPVQKAAAKALQAHPSFYENQRNIYENRRKIAFSIFDELRCTYTPTEGMFVWARIPENVQSSEELTDQILSQAHVFITPGSVFGTNGNRYLRISLCSSEEVLKNALERIKKIEI